MNPLLLTDGYKELNDQVSWAEERMGELKEVFRDGKLLIEHSLEAIRSR